jgi:hypothetical protein
MKVSIENFRKKALAVVAVAEKIVFAFDGSPVTDGNRAQALLDAPRGE